MRSEAASSAPVWELAARAPDRRAAALDDDDRLAPADPPRDPGEPAGVAERLDVEEREPGALVLLPELEQVVGGDVGAVADRGEGGDAEPPRLGELDQGEAEGAALGRRSRRRRRPARSGAKVALSPCSGSVLRMPRQLGPISRIPASRQTASSSRFALGALRADLGEAGGEDDQARWRPWRRIRARLSATASAGTAITARSISSGISADARRRPAPLDAVAPPG